MLFAALATITYAQTDDKGYQEGAWVLKGVTGLNMSQTAMANWSAGGENSIAGNAYFSSSPEIWFSTSHSPAPCW